MSDTASHSQKTGQQVPQLEFEGSQNVEWHLKHKMPENPNLDQQARWYIEHARNCSCTPSGGIPEEDKAASFAVRAAGQAVATAHVPTHALGAVLYAIKAVAATNSTDFKAAVARERDWQAKRLPENLREWVDSSVKQAQQLLPKNIRNLD